MGALMNRTNAAANAMILHAPIAIVILTVIAMNPLFLLAILCVGYAIGLVSLIRSKMSVFRNRQWFSFGLSAMDAKNRHLYCRGYAIIGAAASINLLMVALMGI